MKQLFPKQLTGIMAAVALSGAFIGCGGGGGGSNAAVELGIYQGNATVAAIDLANGLTVAESIVGAKNFNSPVLTNVSLKPDSPNASLPNVLSQIVGKALHPRATALHKVGSTKAVTGCSGGGTINPTNTVNTSGLGAITITYSNCNELGLVMNGVVNTTIIAFDIVQDRAVMSLDFNLTMSYLGNSFTFLGISDVIVNGSTLTDTLVGNFELWDHTSGAGFRVQNLNATDTYTSTLDWESSCVKTSSWSARIFDSALGYVDEATTTPMVWTNNDCMQLAPSSGGPLVLTGSGGATVSLTPLSDTTVSVVIDADGDGVPEATSTELWSALGYL